MRKNTFVMLSIFIFLLFVSQSGFSETIRFQGNWGNPGISLISSSNQGVDIVYSLQEMSLDKMMLEGKEMYNISIPGVWLPNDEGAPNLPGIGKYIALPQGGKVELQVVNIRKEVYENIEIAPAPKIPLDTDDSPLVYKKDESIYNQNAFYPGEPIKISKPKKMRGVDVVILGITPFQYNPVTKELIVYKDIRVRLNFVGGNGHFGEDRLRSKWFEPVLSNNILNYKILPSIDFIDFTKNLNPRAGECEYIIIVPDDPDFIAWADTIKHWRMLQGILTDVYTITDVGGNTVAAIETFVNNAYNTWSIPPVAVILLSDYQSSGKAYGITSPSYTHPYSGTYVTDNTYADIDGDKLPDMNFARITAQDNTDLTEMINKFLDYERNPPIDAGFYDHPLVACGWQTERWFQLCTEVVRGFLDYDLGKNPAKQYKVYAGTPSVGCAWSTATNTATVVNYFGPPGLGYIPATNPYTYAEWDFGTAAGINSVINTGCFIVQHRDHGLEAGWGEPSYRTSDLPGLSNTMLPFVFSINCLTGRFDYATEVFSEHMHRMQHGALGLIAATQVSYSFVNDTYIFGLYDGMWPNFDPGNEFSSQQDTFLVNLRPGFASVSGKYYLEASSWPYNTGSKGITYDLFHTHCDAFITLFSEIPDSFKITHTSTVPLGPSSFTVTVMENDGTTPVKDALVCCWCEVDKAMWVRSHTNSSGQVTLNINPSQAVDSMYVTVTKYNHFRYQGCVKMASGAPSVPSLYNLFDYARDYTQTPTLTFSSTDNEGDNVEFRIYWDTLKTFATTDSVTTPTTYISGDTVAYTFLSPFTNGRTYYWKVRARDPSGSNYWGGSSAVRSFTIGTSLPSATCTWYQQKGTQFGDDNLVDVAIEGDSIVLPSAGGVVTDTIFGEDFESGLPANWAVIDGNGDNYKWTVGTTGDIGSYTPPSYGTQYAYYSDDDAGSGVINTDEELLSPHIYIPSNADSIKLRYGYGFWVYENGETFEVKVRFYKGSWGSWNTIATYTSSGSGTASLDLTADLPADSVQVQWLYHDETSTNHWGYASVTDNVYLIRKRILSNTNGSITGTPVVFKELDDVYTRTSWGGVIWEKSFAGDSISVQVECLSGGVWALVPDVDLPGNSSEFFTTTASGMLSINELDPAIYDTIRVVGHLYRKPGKASTDPSLLSWEVGNLTGFLSVTLTELGALSGKAGVKVFWRTESEADNAYWVIERAVDLKGEWSVVGTTPGQGTKPTPTDYEYMDETIDKDGEYYYRLVSINGGGSKEVYGPIKVKVSGFVPKVYALHKVYPNPFSRRLVISYDVPKMSNISLRVYDVSGRIVKTLVNGKKAADYHSIEWDGKGDGGKRVGYGVYFLRMDAGNYTKTQKLLYVR